MGYRNKGFRKDWYLLDRRRLFIISNFNGSDACVLSIKCITWGHQRNRIYLSQTLTISDWCVITATSRRIGLMRGYTNYKGHGMSTKLVCNKQSDWPHHCILSLSLLQEFVCLSGAGYTHMTIRSAMEMVRKYTILRVIHDTPAD